MHSKLINKIFSKKIILLFLIIAVGIFLRTYNFHDWLRFSMDQSRDALMISRVLAGEQAWPLLGPLAGGTGFYLGSAYYYFSLIAAKIFGNYPDKLAYPSLFFSILAIPLFYFFLKEYFSSKISLILTAILSVSSFAVANSRFSSNPNLTPFFILLFLFSILKFLNNPKEKSWRWPVAIGLSFGIGIQLHTTLFVIMPFMLLVLFIWLFQKERHWPIKSFLVIILFALFVNLPQIVSEYKTAGANSIQFFGGLFQAGEQKGGFLKNIPMIATCQIKANANIISTIAVQDNCSRGIDFNIKKGSREIYGFMKSRVMEKITYTANLIFLLVFSLGGYFFLIYARRKELSDQKKNFLSLVLLYNLVSLFFLLPVAPFLYINYFIILFFIPFILLGLIFNFLEKWSHGSFFVWVAAGSLIIASLVANKNTASYLAQGLDNNLENSNLKWAEDFSGFIKSHNFDATVYLSGENKYLDRYAGPMRYMLYRENSEVTEVDASQVKEAVPPGDNFIYIKNVGAGDLEKAIKGYEVVRSARISPVDIYILKK